MGLFIHLVENKVSSSVFMKAVRKTRISGVGFMLSIRVCGG